MIHFSKINTNEIIHIRILSINELYNQNNILLELKNEKQAKTLIKLGKEIYEKRIKKKYILFNVLKEEITNFEINFRKNSFNNIFMVNIKNISNYFIFK